MPKADMPLPPMNRGLLYGDGVFETMRAYTGSVFRIAAHVRRLFRGLDLLRIPCRLQAEDLMQGADLVLSANSLGDASVKILAFRSGAEGPDPNRDAPADIVITATGFDAARKERCARGVTACIATFRRNSMSPLCSIKSISYAENILGRIEAGEQGAYEALFLNTDGYVAEGATTNVFIVQGGGLVTPPQDAGILQGVTRDAVIECAAQEGLRVSEKNCTPDDMLQADEAFLTNSVMEIIPLVAVGEKRIGSGMPGPITLQLMTVYKGMVERELGGYGEKSGPSCMPATATRKTDIEDLA